MKRKPFLVVAALAVVVFAGCRKESAGKELTSSESARPAPTEDTTKHAAAGVEPGSHDDWCGEHQVPESMCTRCNPKLIAAFKATGDWCNEHGVPESQCKLCNPHLKIERPPRKEEAK